MASVTASLPSVSVDAESVAWYEKRQGFKRSMLYNAYTSKFWALYALFFARFLYLCRLYEENQY